MRSVRKAPCGEDDFSILLPTKSYTRNPTRCGTSTRATQVTGGHTATALKNMGLGNLSADDTDALFAFMEPHGSASKVDRRKMHKTAIFRYGTCIAGWYYLVREDRPH